MSTFLTVSRMVQIFLYLKRVFDITTNPMIQSLGEPQTHTIIGLKELMSEVLCKEGKHKVGALRIRSECSSL